VLLETEAPRVAHAADGVIHLTVRSSEQERVIAGSHLLVSTGRTPNSDRLNLSAAGVRTDTHGFIQANERLETNVPGIYVLGDIKGGPAFTHIPTTIFGLSAATSSRAAAPQPEIAWCPTPCSSIRS